VGRVVTVLRQRLLTAVAGQLGRPHGLVGRGVAIMLNRGNRRSVAAAVEASQAAVGDVAADIGFGGGVGISLLLERVGEGGVVHGVEVADDMLDRARSRFATEAEAGRLRLAHGSLTALPLEDSSLNVAITVNTVYFVDDLHTACAELARVLRPGGRAVVGIGDPDAMARMPFTSYGFTLRPVEDVIAALQNAGLKLVEHQHLSEIAIPHHLLVTRRPD
jgi:arsenite methyltransferase